MEAKLGRFQMQDGRGQSGSIIFRVGSSDEQLIRHAFELGVYDLRPFPRFAELQSLHQKILAAGKTPLILDIGANIGVISNYWSWQLPNCRYLCVEPLNENFDLLQENVRRLDAKAFHAGIASEEGSLSVTMPNPEDYWSAITTRGGSGGESVPAITINSLLAAEPNGVPLIAKIDIEGFENDLFSKNLEWLPKIPMLVMEMHDWLFCKKNTSLSFRRAVMLGEHADFISWGENFVVLAHDLDSFAPAG
ncbi:MAG: FkbM family methyltransferase [Armatimonadetes bacterium]|nr:FkbM family methyltransferase [Armatimonadota bacterium]